MSHDPEDEARYPKLKAKAAATRHLARYALELMTTFGTNSDEDAEATLVCKYLVRFYEILDAETMFLAEATRDEIQLLGRNLALVYASLATKSAQARLKMWKLTPRMHLFVHLCEWQIATHGNPRYYWCYADEALVGLMSEVAATCHPLTMAASALYKWLLLAF